MWKGPAGAQKLRKLKRIEDARRCLADAIRKFEAFDEPNEAQCARISCLTRALTALGGLIRDADIESRLARIEREMQLPAWTLRNRVKIDPRKGESGQPSQ